ncbi:Signal recognition particle 68 kDa protein [Fukomys damarensis]|uniref:Signal recognition particle subunit SRP68 n=1 Tax=Fukomys damarensis TaxID=885580 RepID=A0A091DK01_FUKDA|nr:Signal recognition particle 68 kDa protein [Fukomys damarensis]
MDAKRAWSYATQLKGEACAERGKRFHLLSRLRKAVKHAEELEHSWLADKEAAIAQAESEETKEHLFESMLGECLDAIQAVPEELKPAQKQRDYTPEGESGKAANLQYLCSHLTYIKLSTAIKGNENTANGLQKALLQQQPENDSKCSPGPRT